MNKNKIMKKILETVWKFVNSKIFSYVLILAVAVLFLGTCNRNKDLRNEAITHGKNLDAMNDTISTERLKSGALQVSIDGYVANAIDLENYNAELAQAVKDEKGKVITLSKINFRLKLDSTTLANRVIELEKKLSERQLNDSTWALDWTAPYRDIGTIEGSSIVGINANKAWLPEIRLVNKDIIISSIDIPVEMTWGQKWEGKGKNKKLKIFANTSYPGFEAELLKGTYADLPKERHWFQGFGVGPTLNIGYDFMNSKPAFVVGVGIHYNLYKF